VSADQTEHAGSGGSPPARELSIPFSPGHAEDFFAQFPAAPAVFALRGAEANTEPYVSKSANLRRRLQRLLAPAESQSRRLNLRDRVTTIEYALTGSDFESTLRLYQTLRAEFPRSYQKRLRIRPAPLVRLNLENPYPRAYVTTRLGRPGGKSIYYGPFRSRAAAEKFLNDSLDLFRMRRCTFELNPDPGFPGCVYSEMKMCLAPCFKGCSDQEYATEVARVHDYLESRGRSLLDPMEAERERLSAELDFEAAAAQHEKITKIKGVLSECAELCGRLDRLDAVILQPAAVPGSVAVFRFHHGALNGPELFPAESAEAVSTEARLQEPLARLAGHAQRAAQQLTEELAILKRWYFRTHRTGEIFVANSKGELPMRRIVLGIGRIIAGKPAKSSDPTGEPDAPTAPAQPE